MGRSPCCSKEGLNRGAWTALEDKILTAYIKPMEKGNGETSPRELLPSSVFSVFSESSEEKEILKLLRNRYIKRGNISHDEEELIIRLHKLLGNRWSLIAGRLPGRTDNEIKNYWKPLLARKLELNQQTSLG
ncbi:Anthocyanin regulatory C1 protein [Vitis vinifera]|uniref:Anthocyanin regulatory C1 protein n=1 Tax=Vitis vinifera TaxID=29760 RepID=A0A438EXT7_VITVI|nr:Anthocyanin regulatory C1 protein [Vitis vinifera]